MEADSEYLGFHHGNAIEVAGDVQSGVSLTWISCYTFQA
jgi:hypothetical protein